MARIPCITLTLAIPKVLVLTLSLMPPVDLTLGCPEEKKLDPRRRRGRPPRWKTEPRADDATKDDELARLALLRENGWGVIEGNREELERYGLLPKGDDPPQDRSGVL